MRAEEERSVGGEVVVPCVHNPPPSWDGLVCDPRSLLDSLLLQLQSFSSFKQSTCIAMCSKSLGSCSSWINEGLLITFSICLRTYPYLMTKYTVTLIISLELDFLTLSLCLSHVFLAFCFKAVDTLAYFHSFVNQ